MNLQAFFCKILDLLIKIEKILDYQTKRITFIATPIMKTIEAVLW